MLSLVPRPAAVVTVALLVAGVVLVAIGGDVVAGIGTAVGGLGLIFVVGLAFYAVGRSEDIERERQERPRGNGHV